MTLSPFASQNDDKPAIVTSMIKEHVVAFPKVYHFESGGKLARLYRRLRSVIYRFVGKPDPYRLIPITVITGFLGSGKTTIIINLMKLLPTSYRVAWLKNEFGSTAVDSELAKDNNIATVKEMLSGCLCHVLVGQFSQALEDLIATNPDRIIIETSGSSHPANLVWEIRKHPRLSIDGVIDIIDAKNFHGYKDKSFAAKLQAEYNDLILINKHEGLSEQELDSVLDDVYELNLNVPKIKTNQGSIDPSLIFGIDLKLFSQAQLDPLKLQKLNDDHQSTEVDVLEIVPQSELSQAELTQKLKEFSSTTFYRIKGVLHLTEGWYILNFAFGEFSLTILPSYRGEQKLVFMGEGIRSFSESIVEYFQAKTNTVRFTEKGHRHNHHEMHKID